MGTKGVKVTEWQSYLHPFKDGFSQTVLKAIQSTSNDEAGFKAFLQLIPPAASRELATLLITVAEEPSLEDYWSPFDDTPALPSPQRLTNLGNAIVEECRESWAGHIFLE